MEMEEGWNDGRMEGRRREKEEGWNVSTAAINVCNQLLPATATSHIYFFLLFLAESSTTLRRGWMQSSLGVIIRTPLGGIAAHERVRSRTRQAR